MCGFVGELSVGQAATPGRVRTMADRQWRRGPDDQGDFCKGPVALAFRRLSIIDLSPAGHQPFEVEEQSLAMVFNGEIFNYLELRAELEGLGHRFRSGSDTEVLLASYAAWGTDCLARFNGMWAFLIADFRKGLVFGARDRFGVKPLYRARRGDRHSFSSEIKALREGDPSLDRINWTLASRFLAEGRLDEITTGGATFFEGIEEMPPGHGFTIGFDGTERRWAYWSLPDPADVVDDEGAPQRVRELVEDSVRLRLRSDVPVGVALSGGMDSSSIIAMMSKLTRDGDGRTDLHAFSYMPKEFDEEPYIAESIKLTGATLHRTARTPAELWDSLPEVLAAHDEPLHSPTALVGYQVYALAAKQGVRVVLGGQGADETLGGYPPYFSDAWMDSLRAGRVRETLREIGDYSAGHGADRNAVVRAAVKRFVASTVSPLRGERPYQPAHAGWLRGDAAGGLVGQRRERLPRTLREVLQRGTEQHPLPLFLRIEDRNSMAHSIEARLPFMDYRLVTYAFRLANRWKIRGRWNKYALREGMRGVVPERIRTRVDKMGFPTGFTSWIRGPLKATIEAQIEDPSFARLGVFDVPAVRRAFHAHVAGEADHAMALFHALQFQVWHDRIVRQPASDSRRVA